MPRHPSCSLSVLGGRKCLSAARARGESGWRSRGWLGLCSSRSRGPVRVSERSRAAPGRPPDGLPAGSGHASVRVLTCSERSRGGVCWGAGSQSSAGTKAGVQRAKPRPWGCGEEGPGGPGPLCAQPGPGSGTLWALVGWSGPVRSGPVRVLGVRSLGGSQKAKGGGGGENKLAPMIGEPRFAARQI